MYWGIINLSILLQVELVYVFARSNFENNMPFIHFCKTLSQDLAMGYVRWNNHSNLLKNRHKLFTCYFFLFYVDRRYYPAWVIRLLNYSEDSKSIHPRLSPRTTRSKYECFTLFCFNFYLCFRATAQFHRESIWK